MSTKITWDGATTWTSEHGMVSHDDRRNETRVTPQWRVDIDLADCLSVSMPLADLSVKMFRIELPEMLESGTAVQFSISEDTTKRLEGQALRGKAIVSLTHPRGTAFEFGDFEGDDFNRLCDVLLNIIEDPVHPSG